MSKSNISSAEVYLKRHLPGTNKYDDPLTQAIVQESLWNEGSISVTEKDDLTCLKIIQGSNQITYNYVPITLDDSLPEALWYVRGEPRSFREIKTAEIVNLKNSARLDLIEKLPPQWRTFVDFGDAPEDYCDIVNRSIVITPQFGSKFHYMTLAHEVGHAVDSIKHPHLNKVRYRNRLVRHASELESERNANAFALFYMRRFLSADPLDMFNFQDFHENLNLTLQTYVDQIIQERTKTSSRDSVAKAIGSYTLKTGIATGNSRRN